MRGVAAATGISFQCGTLCSVDVLSKMAPINVEKKPSKAKGNGKKKYKHPLNTCLKGGILRYSKSQVNIVVEKEICHHHSFLLTNIFVVVHFFLDVQATCSISFKRSE